MRLRFRGWSRQITVHNHTLKPAEKTDYIFRESEQATYEVNGSDIVAYGKIIDARLSGTFLVDVILSQDDIDGYIEAMIEQDPVRSLSRLYTALAKAHEAALARISHPR